MGDASQKPDRLRQRIEDALEPVDAIELAYLFGSGARGELGERSDVDIAVGFAEPTDPLARLSLLGQLEDRLRQALGRSVDMVDLYRAPPLLVHEVLKYGRPPALVRDERQRLEFECRARKLYFEMKRRYEVYDREAFR